MAERQTASDQESHAHQVPLPAPTEGPAAEPAVESSPHPAGYLHDRRLHPAQRRALARAAGRLHGNRRLQRMLAARIQRTALADLPEAERRRIQVVTAQVTLSDLHSLFSTEVATTTVPLPTGATADFSGEIPDSLRRGLSSVAGRLIQTRALSLNTTTTVALNLTAYGGDASAYRFTYVERTPAGGEASRQVLIERLGATAAEGLTEPQQQAQQARFTQHGFTRTGGWPEAESAALLEAVALLPDAMLTPVDGLTFTRQARHPTDLQAAGSYDPSTHTVTVYNRAFAASLARFGTPGAMSSPAARAVVHEISHAIDLLPLRQAWARLEAEEQALRTAFQEYEDPPGSNRYTFPSSEQARYNRLNQRITAAERALTQARAASGERWEEVAGQHEMVEGGTAVGSNAFRRAAEQDGGVRVTAYSDREWQEYYAEAFSLYITDPTVLRQLRPRVYAYFVAHNPR